MLTALALTLFAAIPHSGAAEDFVDLVEVNHVYDEAGKAIYTQAVLYDWLPQQNEYQVRAWRLLTSESQRPQRDFFRGDWVMIFHDRGVLREVRAAKFRESWTQYDLEQVERERLPKEYRAGLASGRVEL